MFAASFVPGEPRRILVLAHGFPWLDGSKSDEELAQYAQEAVDRWTPFARQHGAVLLAPALGGRDFDGYQEMRGREIRPDQYVNNLVDAAAAACLPGFDGSFSLHGHSAGGQFAGRYLIAHPGRLDQVVLSAPGTFPFPDPATAWPYGMGQAAGFAPGPASWRAASLVSVAVLVGSRDTEPRYPEPGQPAGSRLDRARAWVASMGHQAEASGVAAGIRLVVADGLDHDEAAMAGPAQAELARAWGHDRVTGRGVAWDDAGMGGP
jgi:pimeloyl-ACP methyl ester carboxylesterase